MMKKLIFLLTILVVVLSCKGQTIHGDLTVTGNLSLTGISGFQFGDLDTRIWESGDDNLYFTIGNTTKMIISTTDFTLSQTVLPELTASYDFGSSSKYWRYGYIGGLYLGTGSVQLHSVADELQMTDAVAGTILLNTIKLGLNGWGTSDQIPHMNTGGTGFDYDADLAFTGGNTLQIGSGYEYATIYHALSVKSSNSNMQTLVTVHNNDPNHTDQRVWYRKGGTGASPTAAPTDALIRYDQYIIYDGTSNVEGGRQSFKIDGAVATGDFDTKWTWYLKDGAAAIAEGMSLSTTGLNVVNNIKIPTSKHLNLNAGATTYIYDNAGVLTFYDATTTAKTLAELAAGGGVDGDTTALTDLVRLMEDTVLLWCWEIPDSSFFRGSAYVAKFYHYGPDTMYITQTRVATDYATANFTFNVQHLAELNDSPETLFSAAQQVEGSGVINVTGEIDVPDNDVFIPPGRWVCLTIDAQTVKPPNGASFNFIGFEY